jgi:hypothetical protein
MRRFIVLKNNSFFYTLKQSAKISLVNLEKAYLANLIFLIISWLILP